MVDNVVDNHYYYLRPVDQSDTKGYQTWVNVKPAHDASVVDVGTRQEPNLETITGLKPDLIIASSLRSSKNYETLSKIAPTTVFNSYPAEGDSVLADLSKAYGIRKQS